MNPFNLSGRWYKGNIHTHTTSSDGKFTVEELKKLYKELGYSFIVITDHVDPRYGFPNKITDVEGASSNDFLVISGAEYGTAPNEVGIEFDIIALNILETIEKAGDVSPQKSPLLIA